MTHPGTWTMSDTEPEIDSELLVPTRIAWALNVAFTEIDSCHPTILQKNIPFW